MSNNLVASTEKQLRKSRIQIEVKEISVKPISINPATQLNSDSDGGDLTNE
ncbi:MAG: hypothetical protein SAK29_31355 [Scytonema sp. PMC 1069.18]|nr:hypothetical protein [Scytonema sp. PMC 1069.18]MEC4879847.1 hypothetical protein [Scytonema sp. PMC 1070.18]